MSNRVRTVAAVTAVGLAGAAVWAVSTTSAEKPEPVSLGRIANIALTTEHDCGDLLAYYRAEATRVVGPYGLNGGPMYMRMAAGDGVAGVASAKAADSGAAGGAESSATTPDSTTNVQVAGVDESDFVKTEGDLMVAVVNGEVRITRLAGAATKTLATWKPAEGIAQSVLLDGSTAVILGDLSGGVMPLAATKVRGPDGDFRSLSTITVLDLTDPAHPRPVRRLELDGNRAGEARLVDGELRLALTATATGITWKQPTYPNWTRSEDQAKAEAAFKRSEAKAKAANKKLIASSTIDNWIPQATVTPLDPDGEPVGTPVKRPLIDCEQVAIPGSFSGLGTLALVSIDLHGENPLSTWRSAGVIAEGSTVYATADHVWLATTRWEGATAGEDSLTRPFNPAATSTQIHRFDTPLRADPKYIASGEIAGSLLSQFSMDEQDGQLRVASTTEGASSAIGEAVPDAAVGSDGSASSAASDAVSPVGTEEATPATIPPTPATRARPESRVTVLAVDGEQLAHLGVVTGLGKGERIRGVRFVGDIGYVVTYRQTDPLYTVDLSDPARPRVRGELSVLGYSAYLHPAGDARLLGLGQDGTKSGTTTGLQLSLFDVSNPDSPTRLDRLRLKNAWSDVEGDHHAFTMAGDLVLIPYNSWTDVSVKDGDYLQRFDAGVIAVRVGADGIGTPTTLRPIADAPVTFDGNHMIKSKVQRLMDASPVRTVVHNSVIYTLTQSGVAAHSATTMDRLTFADF